MAREEFLANVNCEEKMSEKKTQSLIEEASDRIYIWNIWQRTVFLIN